MTKKELYTCDICHTDYVNKADAMKCEKEHCKCVEIRQPSMLPKYFVS